MFFKLFKNFANICTRKQCDLVSEIRDRGIEINKFWGEENKMEGVSIADRNRVERAFRICMEIIKMIRRGNFVEPNPSDLQLFHMVLDRIVEIRKGRIPFNSLQEGEVFWLEDFMIYSNPANVMSKENEAKIRNTVRSVAYETFLKETSEKFENVEEALRFFNVSYNREEESYGIQIKAD